VYMRRMACLISSGGSRELDCVYPCDLLSFANPSGPGRRPTTGTTSLRFRQDRSRPAWAPSTVSKTIRGSSGRLANELENCCGRIFGGKTGGAKLMRTNGEAVMEKRCADNRAIASLYRANGRLSSASKAALS